MVEGIVQDTTVYIPSTIERKRSITSLFFVGIIMMLVVQKNLSVFERYYLALSLSLWSMGLIMFLLAIPVFLLSVLLWYLYVLVLLTRFGFWAFALQQARAWVYNHDFVPIRLLVGFWDRILSIFTPEDITNNTPSL